MKKLLLIPVLLLFFFVLSPTTSGLFTPSSEMNGTISPDTEEFFIGKTIINGTSAGYPMNMILNSSLVSDMEGFPFIGSNQITEVSSVIVAEDIDLAAANSVEDLITLYYDHLSQYLDVDIVTEQGLFLLGVQNGEMLVSADLSYAVTTVINLDILPDVSSRFLVSASHEPVNMQCSADFAVLSTVSNTSVIQIRDKNGNIRWSGGSQNDYVILQDVSFSLTQYPPLSLFPLDFSQQDQTLALSISPANPDAIMIHHLIENVSRSVELNLQNNSTTLFIDNLNELENIIHTASFIANGAMVFLQTNDTITIDRSTQHFSSVGFVRFNSLEVTDLDSSSGPTIQGDCMLTFLGDHFYIPQAKDNAEGIRFPYELVILWIFGLVVFIYIRFYKRPPINTEKDEKISHYALYIHLFVLVLTFILLDVEVNSLFGISALTALIGQGPSFTAGIFFIVETIIWVLGFFILAIPIQLLSYSVLHLQGIGKGGNGIWKAVGDLTIWVFCGLYLLLYLNILFAVVGFQNIFPMG